MTATNTPKLPNKNFLIVFDGVTHYPISNHDYTHLSNQAKKALTIIDYCDSQKKAFNMIDNLYNECIEDMYVSEAFIEAWDN